jgi:alpha-tubulin suppressor-like RCC1 family protein
MVTPCRSHDLSHPPTLTHAHPVATASQKEGSISFLDCGPEYSMAICEGGHVYTWGHGENGKLGHQDNNDKKLPTKVCFTALDERVTL